MKAGLRIETRACNVITDPPKTESFDVIVVSRFLERRLFPYLAAALKPQGLLFYQTFTAVKAKDAGPNNPDYLLENKRIVACICRFDHIIVS